MNRSIRQESLTQVVVRALKEDMARFDAIPDELLRLLALGSRTKAQALAAARTVDEARAQVVKSLRQARAAWARLRAANHGG